MFCDVIVYLLDLEDPDFRTRQMVEYRTEPKALSPGVTDTMTAVIFVEGLLPF